MDHPYRYATVAASATGEIPIERERLAAVDMRPCCYGLPPDYWYGRSPGPSSLPFRQASAWTHACSWDAMFEKLRAFYRQHGHSNVPVLDTPAPDNDLGRWVRRQRLDYGLYRLSDSNKIGSMSPKRIVKLMTLDFQWSLQSEAHDGKGEKPYFGQNVGSVIDNNRSDKAAPGLLRGNSSFGTGPPLKAVYHILYGQNREDGKVSPDASSQTATFEEQKEPSPGKFKHIVKAILPRDFIPGPWSVIIGRDRKSMGASGNQNLHSVVALHLKMYASSSCQAGKTFNISKIGQTIRKRNREGCISSSRGAFIKLIGGRWWEVTEAVARQKIGYTIRERLSHRYSSSSKVKRARKKQLANKSSSGSGILLASKQKVGGEASRTISK